MNHGSPRARYLIAALPWALCARCALKIRNNESVVLLSAHKGSRGSLLDGGEEETLARSRIQSALSPSPQNYTIITKTGATVAMLTSEY